MRIEIARRVIYWLLPLILLALVLHYIDLAQLRQNLERTNLPVLLAGLILFPLTTCLGAIRWSILVTAYNRVAIPFNFVVIQYFIALVTGFFTPGAIGMDVYRIYVIGRKFGSFLLNGVAVLVEKYAAFISCMLLIIAIYPFLRSDARSEELPVAVTAASIFLVLALLLAFVVFLADRSFKVKRAAQAVEHAIGNRLKVVADRLDLPFGPEDLNLPLGQVIRPLRKPGRFWLLLLLSFGIQANSALAAQLLFQACGYEISYLINLFLSPVFFILLLVPISFAGIGVREASYVVLYGLFGVPPETALLVGFFSLTGTLLSNIIGGLLLYTNKRPGK